MAERGEPELRGARQATWFSRLEREHANVRAALEWAWQHDPQLALRLGVAFWRFWHGRWYLGEGRLWLERLLDAPACRSAPAGLRAQALCAVGALVRLQGDLDLAARRSAEGLALSAGSGDRRTAAFALNTLGLIALDRHDLPDAARKFEESLALRRQNSDEAGLANSLANLARVVEIQGEQVRATQLLEESLELRRRLGDESGISQSLMALARIARKQQDDDRALALLCKSLKIARKLGAKRGTAECLEGLAAVAMLKGHAASAVRLLAAANHLYEDSEFIPRPHDDADRQQTMELARARLGESAFAAEWTAGSSMSLEEQIGQLLGNEPTPDECSIPAI